MASPPGIEPIMEAQIARLAEQIKAIDARLAELGDSDEDRIEELLLKAARRHLVEDLKALTEFVGSKRLRFGKSMESAVVLES